MTQLNLLKDDERKVFKHYLLPSICSTLITAIYLLVDTLIIGKGVGTQGISALNIFLPIFSVYMGLGFLFGIGGGVLISTEDGLGNLEKSNTFLITSIISVIITSIIITLILTLNLENVAYLLGANENNINLVLEYAKCIVYSTPIFILSNFFGPIIRNRKDPNLCMVAVITGALLNILLDYVFVFPMNMGMKGAALATVLGSFITLSILLTHFVKKNNRIKLSFTKFSLKGLINILSCGFSSFLMEVASGFIIFIFNLQILKYIGEDGIVVYGIISNCILVGIALFNGVAQASQPIISTNFGASESVRVNNILKLATKTTTIIGVSLVLISFFFTEKVINVFVHSTEEIIKLGVPAIRMYLSAFCIMNINILLCNYFQAIGKEKVSVIISIIRGFLLNIILLLVIPTLLGGNGLWIVVPLTELITIIAIQSYLKISKKEAFIEG